MRCNSLAKAPVVAVSHNDNIKKQRLVASGEVSGLTNFSRAVFPPGETAPSHCHQDMTEIFFVESGRGEMQVDDSSIVLEPGCCVTVEPGEYHEIHNPGPQQLVLIYLGVEH